MKRFLMILISLSLSLSVAACVRTEKESDTTAQTDEATAAQDANDEWETVEEGIYSYESPAVPVAEAEYVSDDEKAKWKEPLKAFLSTLHAHFYTVEIDPDAEYPEDRYMMVDGCEGVALFDVTADGIPEVAVRYAGGSAGNSGFDLYDLYTGQKIGYFDSGWTDDTRYGDWAIYRDREGNFKPFGTYNYRIGWAQTDTFFSSVEKTQRGWGDAVHYTVIRIFEGDMAMAVRDMGYTFYKGSAEIDKATFEADLRAFAEEYTRIEGTEMINIEWRELDGYTDETPQDVLAEKMTEALLHTEQRFVAGRE